MVKNTYSLEWSVKAANRLKDIYNWNVDEFGKRRADKIKNSIIAVAQDITSNPYKHPICDKLEHPVEQIRNALVEKTFWIVFQIMTDKIVILQLFHGAMNPDEYNKLK